MNWDFVNNNYREMCMIRVRRFLAGLRDMQAFSAMPQTSHCWLRCF